MTPEKIMPVVYSEPISIIVIRSILGFTPPEWAYIATQKAGLDISQGFIRSLDRKVRMEPEKPLKEGSANNERVVALVQAACDLLSNVAPSTESERIHRLDKADTRGGLKTIQARAEIGVPYAMLLYERFLGRPFAGHRDSVSDIIGDNLESAIEEVLSKSGISFRKTKRAEKIEGFD